MFSRHETVQTETLLKLCKANDWRKKCQAGSFNWSAANFCGFRLMQVQLSATDLNAWFERASRPTF
jgi:hypothetical protein